jgi:hypothetical protein
MSNQGFVLPLNLDQSEISNSAQLWDNLYDGSIALDIQLFQPITELIWNKSLGDTISDNQLVFSNQVRVFPSGTFVEVYGSWSTSNLVAGATYEVISSTDGKFALQDVVLQDQDVEIIQFVRGIEQLELFNLVLPTSSTTDDDEDIYNIIDLVKTSLDSLQSDTDTLDLLIQKKLLSEQSFRTNTVYNVGGAVVVEDSANYNSSEQVLNDAISPGVFVANPNSFVEDIQTLRTNSVTDNPWQGPQGPNNSLQTIAASVSVNELEINHTSFRVDNMQVTTVPDLTSLSVGEGFSAIIDRQSRLWTAGSNQFGQLGRGSTQAQLGAQPVFVNALQQQPAWTQVSAGTHHVLALDQTGALWSWGRNNQGQLGNGTTTDSAVPQLIMPSGVTFIHANVNSSVCLMGSQLMVWGSNTFGQLGLGNTQDQVIPVPVSGAWKHVNVGNHMLAVNTQGRLFACGLNNFGQLGVGNQTNTALLVQVGSATNWLKTSVGTHHSLALRDNQSLWSWGRNHVGQLGLSGTINRITPTSVTGSQTWLHVTASNEFSLAINSNHALYATGFNTQGQLGINSMTNRNSFTQLGISPGADPAGRRTWATVASHGASSIGINSFGELYAWGSDHANSSLSSMQPSILFAQTVTVVDSVQASNQVQVNDVTGILINSTLSDLRFPDNTRVIQVNESTNLITLSNQITIASQMTLTFIYRQWDSNSAVLFDLKSPITVNGQIYHVLLKSS